MITHYIRKSLTGDKIDVCDASTGRVEVTLEGTMSLVAAGALIKTLHEPIHLVGVAKAARVTSDMVRGWVAEEFEGIAPDLPTEDTREAAQDCLVDRCFDRFGPDIDYSGIVEEVLDKYF